MWTEYKDLASKIEALDFDTVFRVADGNVITVPDVYAPEVYHDETDDVVIYGEGWECITGMTGQYCYHGAVMHPSEHVGARIAERIVDLSEDYPERVFALVVVGDADDGDDTAGWAIAYR